MCPKSKEEEFKEDSKLDDDEKNKNENPDQEKVRHEDDEKSKNNSSIEFDSVPSGDSDIVDENDKKSDEKDKTEKNEEVNVLSAEPTSKFQLLNYSGLIINIFRERILIQYQLHSNLLFQKR